MKIKAISLLLALALMLCACGANAEPVEYIHDTGLTITMPAGFEKIEAQGFLGGYQNRELVVNVVFNEELYESLANVGIDPDMTLEEYGQLILNAYGKSGTAAASEQGIPYVRYDQIIEGNPVTYYAYLYQNDVAFWTITFMCAEEDTETMQPEFDRWAASVRIPAEAVSEPYIP